MFKEAFEILDILFIFSSVLFKLIILLLYSIESNNKFLFFKLFPNKLDLFSELVLVFFYLPLVFLLTYLIFYFHYF